MSDGEAVSDFELMDRVRSGDERAFESLVQRHQRSLRSFFSLMNASPSDGDDLVQEVFVRLFSCRHRYRPQARFTTFLYTLARRVSADHWRKAKRHAALPPLSDGRNPDLDVRLDIQGALAELSEKLRSVVVLGVCQGFKYCEIAEILGIPEGTVKSRMYLALRQLKEILSDERDTRQKLR